MTRIKRDYLPVAVRAYAPPRKREQRGRGKREYINPDLTLILDCIAAEDGTEAMVLGSWLLRSGEREIGRGVFYDPSAVDGKGDPIWSPEAIETLAEAVGAEGIACLDRDTFASEIFMAVGYDQAVTWIGAGLPYVLSRIAIAWGPARGSMAGGFSFTIARKPGHYKFERDPRICIASIDGRRARIQFASANYRQYDRKRRKRRKRNDAPTRRGNFVDVLTAGEAIYGETLELSPLATLLKFQHCRELMGNRIETLSTPAER
jgi:hypothetical protein